ncbi:MAG: YceI family protein [Chthoniobacter sp.]|nr:YceI family protein [Chthoniobacter sp.]
MQSLHPVLHSVSLTLVLFAFCTGGCAARAATQDLPLDAARSKLTFVGDSFLHSFHGEAKEIAGSAALDTEARPPVQKATLHFKTAALTTFHDGRDQKMREWLKINMHPDANFALDNVKLVDGDMQNADAQHPAKFTVAGTFTLNGVKQPISGDALGWREKDHLVVSGDTVVDTLKYGLPQIREAFMTVGTNVKVSYRFSFVLPAEFALK